MSNYSGISVIKKVRYKSGFRHEAVILCPQKYITWDLSAA